MDTRSLWRTVRPITRLLVRHLRSRLLLKCALLVTAMGPCLPSLASTAGLAAPAAPVPVASAAPAAPAASASGFLHTDGARLLDASGRQVRLTGINWFGLETCAFAPHGLWARNWRALMVQIKTLGFNTIRLPFSNQLFDAGSTPNGIDYTLNPDLKGLSSVQIMDKVVEEARVLGLKVLLDQHRPDCGAQSALWYTDHYSEARWIADWVMLAKRYAGNDAVIGADLHNEPHGPATWGDGNPSTDWRLAAERAGDAILRANPDWLIVVEGIEHVGADWYWWGGNLANARRYPVRLSVPQRLVYSVHDYGPEVSLQSWFAAPDFPRNLAGLWEQHWGYLQEQGSAPVLVGEFGGKAVDSGREGAWIHTLMQYIHTHRFSYTFWCLNPNSGDTGGILADDWTTVNTVKMALLRPDLAPLIGTGAALGPGASQRVAASPSTTPRRATPRPQRPGITPVRRPSAAAGRRWWRPRRAGPGRMSAAAPAQGPAQRSLPIAVRATVNNGVSTGEDDLTLLLPARLYQVRITLTVQRAAPGADPGEANPQALTGGVLDGRVTTRTALESGRLVYTFTGAPTPVGHGVVAARFDFTSGRQNQNGVHRYGQDTYTIHYATTPNGTLTTLAGHF